MFLIWNIAFVGEVSLHVFVITLLFILVITHSLDQVKIKYTSKLINGISKVLQKLLRYLNGTAIQLLFTRFAWRISNYYISRIINFITFCIGNFYINIISTPATLVSCLKDSKLIIFLFGKWILLVPTASSSL